MVVVWVVVLVIVVVMLGVMVVGDKWCDGGGGEWRCSVVDVVSCGGWWWPGAKVECAPAAQQERIPAA